MERIVFKNSNGQKIVGDLETANSEDEVALFLHGFSSNRDGGPKVMAKALLKNNINSFRIDFDDQGESEPKLEDANITAYKDTALCAIKEMEKRGFHKIDLIGTSFGGAVALAVANEYPLNKLVLRAPVLDHYKRMIERYGQDELQKSEKQGYFVYKKSDGRVLRIDYGWIEDGKNYPFEEMKDLNIPILIIHGTNDQTVDYSESRKAVKEFPNAELVTVEGADHHLGVNGDWSISLNALIDFLK
jgi:pimeloyl-ACP methyl ester carboxylesterase